MRATAIICAILALLLAAFSLWGLSTPEGRRAYDEMDGIIPAAAGALSAMLVLCAVLAFGISRRNRR